MAELDGFEAMLAALRQVQARVYANTPVGLTQAAHHFEAQAKVLLGLRSHAPGTPTPSPPDSPPAMISGTLRRSVQVEEAQPSGPGRWTAKVGADVVYARVQELGGGPSSLPARPYMAPALVLALPGMGLYIEEAWSQALRT